MTTHHTDDSVIQSIDDPLSTLRVVLDRLDRIADNNNIGDHCSQIGEWYSHGIHDAVTDIRIALGWQAPDPLKPSIESTLHVFSGTAVPQ